MGLSSRPKCVLNYRLIVSGTFKQSKHRIKIAALMLPLPTEATSEEKTNTCTDWRHPTYRRIPQMIIKKKRKKERKKGEGLGWGKKNKESLIKTFKTERYSFFSFSLLFFWSGRRTVLAMRGCCNLTIIMIVVHADWNGVSSQCVLTLCCVLMRGSANSTQTASRGQENLEWEGVTGSLTCARIKVTDTAGVMRCAIIFELMTSSTFHC